MDFHQLLAKMQQLDQPVPETQVAEEPVVTDECGPMGSPMEMSKPDTQPPNMSINLNAQGMDDIAELMKLMTKVNPDMINQPSDNMPPMGMEPSIAIKPAMSPLKMLPDLDSDNDEMPGGEKDMDGEEPEMKKDKEEAFGNSLGNSEPEEMGMDAAVPDGNDLNKPKKSFSGKPYRGDNPMAAGAYESTDLRASIRAELLRRLEEAKGAK